MGHGRVDPQKHSRYCSGANISGRSSRAPAARGRDEVDGPCFGYGFEAVCGVGARQLQSVHRRRLTYFADCARFSVALLLCGGAANFVPSFSGSIRSQNDWNVWMFHVRERERSSGDHNHATNTGAISAVPGGFDAQR